MAISKEQLQEAYETWKAVYDAYQDAPEDTPEEADLLAKSNDLVGKYNALKAEYDAQKAVEKASGYTVNLSDTSESLSGGILADGEWEKFAERKWKNDTIRTALSTAMDRARALAAEQNIALKAYVANARITDDGSIAAAITTARDAYAVDAAKPAVPTYPCAGASDGCAARVTAPRSYCARCAHDEE